MRLTVAMLAICASTAGLSATRDANITHGCVDHFDAAVDYFPDKVTVEDAHIFAVEYRRSFKVVTLREPYPGGPAEKYVLLQCGAPKPALTGELAGAQIVPVPITSLYAASTTHLPMLVDLGRLDVLTGVSALKDLIGDEILKRAATG